MNRDLTKEQRRWGVGTRLRLSMAASALAGLLAAGVAVFAFIDGSRSVQVMALHDVPMLVSAEELARHASAMSAATAMVLGAHTDEERASAIRSARLQKAAFDQHLNELSGHDDTHAMAASLWESSSRYAEVLTEIEQTASAATPDVLDQLLRRQDSIANEMVATADLLSEAAGERIAETSQRMSSRMGQDTTLLVLLGITSLLAAGVAIAFVNARIARRLQTLRSAMATANAQQELPNIDTSGEDEIGDIARAVHRFAEARAIAEQELLASRAEAKRLHAQLVDAVESINQGFILFDAQGRLQLSNSRILSDLQGWVEVRQGMSFKELFHALAHSSYAQSAIGREEQWIADRLADFAASATHESRTPDGKTYRISYAATSDGGTTLVRTDITDLRQRENELREAKEAAEHANVSKTRFLAAASHDLRQPLQALGLFVATLAARPLRDEEKAIVSKLEASLEALEGLLDALLDISKLDAGVVEPQMGTLSLSTLLARLAVEFEPVAAAKGLELRLAPTDLSVHTDPKLLERVLRNLLSNAIRYTEKGGILFGCRRRGRKGRIEVWDTGRGIPSDQTDQIFREFYQLDNPARDRRKGLGLGLAIVQRTATLLGHAVEVKSRPGIGSVFSVTLPLAEDQPDPVVHTETADIDVSGSVVLVIDDDAAVLEGLRTLLTAWGCQVITADSAASGLSALVRFGDAPDIIIADYRLRDRRTGAEAIAVVRKEYGATIPALLITGDTAPQRLRQALRSGFPLLHKPVRPDKLRNEMIAALAGQTVPSAVNHTLA